MKQSTIEDIHQAASLIRAEHPRLALRLYTALLEQRPNGEVIKRALKELQAQLGYKSYVVIGNCQARPTSNLLMDRSLGLLSRGFITAFNYTHAPETDTLLDEVDYIFTQKLADTFPHINTSSLVDKYGADKVITISNLFFEGYHPDWCYIPSLHGTRLTGPVGDYHNRTVVAAFMDGLSEEEALERYLSVEFNRQHYSHVARDSIEELKAREVDVITPMAPVIEDAFEKGKKTFYTFNHPSNELLELHVDRIINTLKIEPNFRPQLLPKRKESLGATQLRTDISAEMVNGNSETLKDGEALCPTQFISEFYQIYRNNPDYIEAYKQRLMK